MARKQLPLRVAGKIDPERYHSSRTSSSCTIDPPDDPPPLFDFHVFVKYTEERSRTLDALPPSRAHGLMNTDIKALRCSQPRKDAVRYVNGGLWLVWEKTTIVPNGLVCQWNKIAVDIGLRKNPNIHHISTSQMPVGAQVEIESSHEHATRFKIVSPSHLAGDSLHEDSRSDITLVDSASDTPPHHLERQLDSQQTPHRPERHVHFERPARVDPRTQERVQKLTRELWDARREMQAAHARSQAVSRELDRLGARKPGRPEEAWEDMAELTRKLAYALETLRSERRRREQAESLLAQVGKECQDPFIVPALLEAFEEISTWTNRDVEMKAVE